jgi:type IV pilus assembly protein PilC
MDPHFRAVLEDVTQTVQSGGQFSTALRKFPKVFPPVMTSLLRASEMSGTMSGMLDRISQYMTKEQQTLKQAKGAMMYPMFMVVLAISVTIFLLTFVLPRFAAIYATRNAALPVPTQILMNISSVMVNYWYIWVGLTVTLTVGGWAALLTKQGRRCLDWFKLNMPLVGRLYQQLYITRSCRTMGTMINAGVSMLDMVAIIKHVTDNAYFHDLWEDVDDKLRQGSQLSDSLFTSPLIPRSIGQMVYSGERSGQLGKVMNRIADFTEVEFDQTVKTVTSMIEPIMVAVMGTIIGFVAISLLLPIFSIGKVVAG